MSSPHLLINVGLPHFSLEKCLSNGQVFLLPSPVNLVHWGEVSFNEKLFPIPWSVYLIWPFPYFEPELYAVTDCFCTNNGRSLKLLYLFICLLMQFSLNGMRDLQEEIHNSFEVTCIHVTYCTSVAKHQWTSGKSQSNPWRLPSTGFLFSTSPGFTF